MVFYDLPLDIKNLVLSHNLGDVRLFKIKNNNIIKNSERDPVSVGFLHTPNFAAFWPKPRKKMILGQCAGIMQTVLHLTPPPCRCQEHREIERFWDNVLVSCKQFSTLPPLADVRLLSQNRKNIEKSKDFVQNQKKTSRNRKKPKKPKILGQCAGIM